MRHVFAGFQNIDGRYVMQQKLAREKCEIASVKINLLEMWKTRCKKFMTRTLLVKFFGP